MDAKDIYKVKVQIGDAKVEIEGAESGVVQIVKALSEVLAGKSSTAGEASSAQSEQSSVSIGTNRFVDIRSFFAQKKPRSNVEAATVAAFYYQYLAPDSQRMEVVDVKLLEHAFRQAKWKLPKAIGQLLVDAKKSGYFDPAGQTGGYKLSPVGYNLVEHTLGSIGS